MPKTYYIPELRCYHKYGILSKIILIDGEKEIDVTAVLTNITGVGCDWTIPHLPTATIQMQASVSFIREED